MWIASSSSSDKHVFRPISTWSDGTCHHEISGGAGAGKGGVAAAAVAEKAAAEEAAEEEAAAEMGGLARMAAARGLGPGNPGG